MENKKAVAWKVNFIQPDRPTGSFSKIYEDEAVKDKWVRLHKLAGFTVEVTPLYG